MIYKIYITNALPVLVKTIGGLLILAVFVSHLGKEGLGLASQYQSLITLGYGMFNALIFNFAVKNRWDSTHGGRSYSQFLAWLIKFSLLCTVALAIVSSPLSSLLLNDSSYSLFVFLGTLQFPLIAIYIALAAKMCSGNQQISYNLIVAISTGLGFLGISVLTSSFGMTGALIGLGVFYIPAFICQSYISRKDLLEAIQLLLSKTISYNCKPLLKFSSVAIVSAFLAIAVQMVIRNLLARELGWQTVGDWQLLSKISESYLMLASIPLFTFFLPKYSSLTEKKAKYTFLVKILKLSFLIVIGTGLIIYASWHGLLEIIIGSQFHDLKSSFGLQLVGDVFKILTWVFITTALGDNRLSLVLLVEILFSVLYMTLVYFSLSKYGLNGAIASYSMSYLVVAAGMFVFYKRIYAK
jgi:O-antigen/teichoic acid export membrane protein